jgi:hypothetical protein
MLDGFFDTLGPLLYHADQSGPFLQALDRELRWCMPPVPPVDTSDTVVLMQQFSQLRLEVDEQRRRDGATSDGLKPGRRSSQSKTCVNKLRICDSIAPDLASQGSEKRFWPISPQEVWEDALAGLREGKKWKPCVDISIIAECDIDGTPCRLNIKQVQRTNFEAKSVFGHLEAVDRDARDANEYMLNLARRACTEFVEELGSYSPDGVSPIEVRDGVCHLHGHPVFASVYHTLTPPGAEGDRVYMTFSVDVGRMPVSEVMDRFCSGVPRDAGFESVGRKLSCEPIHKWGTKEAEDELNDRTLWLGALNESEGSLVWPLVRFCTKPYCYPPDIVAARVRSFRDFNYCSRDGVFAAPAAPPLPSASANGCEPEGSSPTPPRATERGIEGDRRAQGCAGSSHASDRSSSAPSSSGGSPLPSRRVGESSSSSSSTSSLRSSSLVRPHSVAQGTGRGGGSVPSSPRGRTRHSYRLPVAQPGSAPTPRQPSHASDGIHGNWRDRSSSAPPSSGGSPLPSRRVGESSSSSSSTSSLGSSSLMRHSHSLAQGTGRGGGSSPSSPSGRNRRGEGLDPPLLQGGGSPLAGRVPQQRRPPTNPDKPGGKPSSHK